MDAPDLSKILAPRAAADFELFRRIILPETIDHLAYVGVLQTLTYAKRYRPTERVEIWCNGGGGDSDSVNAIIDVIRQHGKCTGILAGTAFSGHSMIFAACDRRYVYPHGAIAIHLCQVEIETAENEAEPSELNRALAARHRARNDELMLALYAAASNQNMEWWREKCPDSQHCEIIAAEELIEIGMAKPAPPVMPTTAVNCEDCGKPYGGEDWLDVIIPDDLFAEIMGNDYGAGILCANCIVARVARLDRYVVGRLAFEDGDE